MDLPNRAVVEEKRFKVREYISQAMRQVFNIGFSFEEDGFDVRAWLAGCHCVVVGFYFAAIDVACSESFFDLSIFRTFIVSAWHLG